MFHCDESWTTALTETTQKHTTENQVKHVWVSIRFFRTEPRLYDPLDVFQREESKWGQRNLHGSGSRLELHSPFHRDLPRFLEDLLVQLGQLVPVKETFRTLKKQNIPTASLIFFQQKLSATLSLYVSALLFSTEIMLVFFQGCIFRCLLLKKSVSFPENHTQLPPDG